MRRFEGKTIVVTGSGRPGGLGCSILGRFADEGANCVVSDLGVPSKHLDEGDIGTTQSMTAIADDLSRRGVPAIAVACDVRDPADCDRLADRAVKEFGSVDVLVNNAGIGYIMKPLLEVTPSEWDAVLAVNLSGAFFATQSVARRMVAQGRPGRVINIASQAAKSAFPHMAPYCSSKHGMIGLTRACAIDLGKHGITVNAVCPNHVTTGLGAKQNDYFSRLMGFKSVEDYLSAMSRRNPLGRHGRGFDTAAACAWLASDDAEYVTGEAVNVSGGEEMH